MFLCNNLAVKRQKSGLYNLFYCNGVAYCLNKLNSICNLKPKMPTVKLILFSSSTTVESKSSGIWKPTGSDLELNYRTPSLFKDRLGEKVPSPTDDDKFIVRYNQSTGNWLKCDLINLLRNIGFNKTSEL